MDENRKQLIIDYGITFDSDSGKRVLEDLCKFCGYDGALFQVGAPDATVFSLGLREVFLHIKAKIAEDPHKERITESQTEIKNG